jgi:hypothetical protein
MSISHTPGPWQQADGDDMEIEAAVGAAICTVLTAVDFPCVEDVDAAAVERECEANARLIAAAPELLSALETVMANNRTGATGQIARDGWAKARAAISKATSRQPEGER